MAAGEDSIGVASAAVVGAGTMGHGISQVLAMAGASVVLVDRTIELAAEGIRRVTENLDKGVERGKVEPGIRDATIERLSPGSDLESAAAGADLVVEAVPERPDLKRDVLAAAERGAPQQAVLATNTSSLSITTLQDALDRPERLVGLHFFNPVHIMKLVEVVQGERTTRDVVERAAGIARWIGKEPIIVRDSPGCASSRLGVALGLEAMRLLEEGVASAEDIDPARTLGYRHPMGPLRLTDLVGLDVRLHIAEYLHEALGDDRFRPPEILREKVERGELGKKAGRGFFTWDS